MQQREFCRGHGMESLIRAARPVFIFRSGREGCFSVPLMDAFGVKLAKIIVLQGGFVARILWVFPDGLKHEM